jgi:hypothetical protein
MLFFRWGISHLSSSAVVGILNEGAEAEKNQSDVNKPPTTAIPEISKFPHLPRSNFNHLLGRNSSA